MLCSSSRLGHQFHQHSVDALGMDERHLAGRTDPPAARSSISSAPAAGGVGQRALGGRSPRRRHGACPGPRFSRNRPTGVSGPSGAQQLDADVADVHRCRLDSLLRHRLAVLEGRPQQPLVGADGGVEVGHGMPDMMDGERVHCARMLRDFHAQGAHMEFLDKLKVAGDGRGVDRRREDAGDGQDRTAADAAANTQGRGEGRADRLRPQRRTRCTTRTGWPSGRASWPERPRRSPICAARSTRRSPRSPS